MIDLARFLFFAILGFLSLLIGNLSLLSQNHIQKLAINPLNRLTIYFSDVPADFSTKLSNDKQKVVILFKNTMASDSAREAHTLGIITDVYVQPFKNNTEVSILLKDKRGYTSAPLIFSKALITEVFKWDKLSPDEDNYRTGLLALESGIVTSAKNDFENAVNSGNSDAAVFLGILQLQNGEIKSSLKNLLFAFRSHVNIPDAYAALSQILKMNNRPSEANSMAKQFYKMTGLNSFPQIVVPEAPDSAMSENNYDSLLRELCFIITKDSAELAVKADTEKKDSVLNQKFKKAIQSDNKQKEKKGIIIGLIESLFPPGYGNVILVFVLLIIIIVLIFIFRYIKWRNEQLLKKNTVKKPSGYGPNLRGAGRILPDQEKAVNAYKKPGAIIDKKIGGNEQKPLNPKIINTETTNSASSGESFESRLEKIANEIEGSYKSSVNIIDNDVKGDNSKKHLTAKLELALHLQEEQQKLKQKSLRSMDADEITANKDKLLEVAKNLGIGTSSISLKKQISDMKKDKEVISKLAKKFDIDTDKKNE